jgi:hypothetical protein
MTQSLFAPDFTNTGYDYSVQYKSPKAIEIFQEWYDNRLARLNLPYESRLVNTRFGKTHILVTGKAKAPPLIFLHNNLDDVMEMI